MTKSAQHHYYNKITLCHLSVLSNILWLEVNWFVFPIFWNKLEFKSENSFLSSLTRRALLSILGNLSSIHIIFFKIDWWNNSFKIPCFVGNEQCKSTFSSLLGIFLIWVLSMSWVENKLGFILPLFLKYY